MRTPRPETLRLAALLALMVLARSAAAADAPACWNRDVERMDYFTNPPERGDNNFFTTVVAQTGNVTLLYPAKASMNEFSQKIYRIRVDLGGATPTECGNPYLNGLKYFMPIDVIPPAGASNLQGVYNPATTYPDPETTYAGGGGLSDGFASGSFYRYGNWPANSAGIAETAAVACAALKDGTTGLPIPNTNVQNCQKCLGAIAGGTNHGYYLNPFAKDNDNTANAGVFSGNWLNFHPPKWAVLRLAYKRLVNGPLLSVLREAVVAQNGAQGGQVVQKMLPQSCQGQGRPLNQKLSAVDNLTYTSAANPLSEMLFNTAWFMGGQESTWVFGGDTHFIGGAPGKSGPCNGCNADFMVLFSDGRGDTANPACAALGGVVPAQCTAASACDTLGMGAEDDGNDFLNPATHADVSAAITGATVRQTWPGTCDQDFADDVAGWMNNNNVSYSTAATHVKTYVVAVGDPGNTYGEMSALQGIASRGDGLFVVADDFRTLETNIERVFQDIIRRSTSFSVAAITTVQTRGSTFAFIPRFRPLQGPQWEGRLLRFKLFNEFAAGCDATKDLGTKSYQNPNGNNSCTDLYLRDKNNDFVAENTDAGNFYVLDSNAALQADGGWPLKTGADGGYVAAVPVWEAEQVMEQRMTPYADAGTFADDRKIYTVAPDGGAYGPGVIDFSIANASSITPLLQLNGRTGDFCTSLAGLTRHTYATDDDCTVDVIKFMRGYDVMLQNPANRTPVDGGTVTILGPRPNIIGDIFHSSPTLVTPPVGTGLCGTGLFNQCLQSLFKGPTPSATYAGFSNAYEKYVSDNKTRQEVVLVGANDGMIHAFAAGVWTLGDDPDTPQIEAADAGHFDYGTGRELWAFIPPDLLPKLQRYIVNTRHETMVDGTAWVRDVWIDGSGATAADYKKQSDEFHTVAVVGEREGGRHYTALDLSDTTAPKYLWSWPKPGTSEELNVGESWNDVAPNPPPIGNVFVDDPASPVTTNTGVKGAEKWVVAFGGGYDSDRLRGRGVYVLDVWTGNLVWKFTKADSTGATDLRDPLMPVAATPAFVDTNFDYTFDTLLVGDIGGQLWTFSLINAGKDTNGDGLYDNWYGARTFIEQKGQPLYKRAPFFYRVGAVPIQTANGTTYFRALLGSGNRDQIKDGQGGTCGLADLDACMRQNCSVDVTATTRSIGGHYQQGRWTYSASGTSYANNVISTPVGDTQSSTCLDKDSVNISYTLTCGATTQTLPNTLSCDWAAGVTGGVECADTTGKPLGTKLTWTPTVTQEYTKFYSVQVFDASGTRSIFDTAAKASSYDAAALSETDLIDASTCPASPSAGACATGSGNGWFLNHSNTVTGQANTPGDEKTGSSVLVISDCAIWNTLLPNNSATLQCNGYLPPDNAFVYQGNAATGHIQCGLANSPTATTTTRSVRRDTNVTPQQFTQVLGVNAATGEVALSGVSIEPGAPPLQIQVGTSELVGPVHWLEVPRTTHNCRHGLPDGGVSCQ